MCANCGFPASPGHWTEAGAATAHDRLRARFRRERVLRAALGGYGLTADDDGVTPGIALSTRTGACEIVADLAELWTAAERMAGRPVDPLDPRFTGDGPAEAPAPPPGPRG